MTLRIAGYTILAVAAAIVLIVLYRNSPQSDRALMYSPSQTLAALWNQYKQVYLEPDTFRTVDTARDNVTTSEGQSYTMLRAVWMGDKPTFDGTWRWTRNNLSRSEDNLFAWLWGLRSDGTYGVLTEKSGHNSATDADTNIALALIFAYSRWQDPSYLTDARAILRDIWKQETLTIGTKTYVLANNVEKFSASPTALVNPSYLFPAAYRIFAMVDPARPWLQATDGAYETLIASTRDLSATSTASLPQNWLALDKTTGRFMPPETPGTDINFGYDAMRVPWSVALDWEWFRDPRALETIKQYAYLSQIWRREAKLMAGYLPNGEPAPQYNYETPAMYGGAIGYFMLADADAADDVFKAKLSYLFTPDWSGWRQTLSYYDDNWAWFGIGLYTGLLPNLTEGLPLAFFNTSSS
jgi:endoglucanase